VSTLVATAVELDNAMDEQMSGLMSTRRLVTIVSAITAIVFSIGISIILGRLISRPIAAMTAAMRQLANGDLAVAIPESSRKDEVGQMAQAMLVFKDNALKARELQAAADKAHGDNMRRHADMERHTQDFGSAAAGVMANLAQSAAAIRETATEMSQ